MCVYLPGWVLFFGVERSLLMIAWAMYVCAQMLRRARWIIKKRRRNFCHRAGGRRGREGKHGNANDHGRPPSRMIMPNYLPRTSAAKLSFLPTSHAANCWWNINDATQTPSVQHWFDARHCFFLCGHKVEVSFSLFHLWGGGEKRALLIQLPRFIRETLDGSAERVSRRAVGIF